MSDPTPARTTVSVGDDEQMPVQLWSTAGEHPTDGVPVVVLVQEIFGVSDYIRQRAADVHALGYTVVVPEVYWRLDDHEVDESREDFLQQAMGVVQRLDWDTAVADLSAVVAWARGAGAPVGLLGFCFGGGLAFHVAAETEVDALVAYYGSALPDLLGHAERVTAPALYLFGEADDYLPMPVVERIRAAVSGRPGAEFVTYPGANHAFDNPRPMFHHPEASRAAWQRTTAFLAAHLPVAPR